MRKCEEIAISYETEVDEIERDLMEIAEENKRLNKIIAQLLKACENALDELNAMCDYEVWLHGELEADIAAAKGGDK